MLQPKRVYSVLVPLMVIAFLVSGIGSNKTPSDGGTYWVGAIGWFTFCAAFLATLAFTVFVVVRMTRRRKAAAPVG